jgi:hypothetical protein
MGDPRVLPYNAGLSNFTVEAVVKDPPCTIFDVRQGHIIENPSAFKVAVSALIFNGGRRFPVTIADIDQTQSDPTVTNWLVTLQATWTGVPQADPSDIAFPAGANVTVYLYSKDEFGSWVDKGVAATITQPGYATLALYAAGVQAEIQAAATLGFTAAVVTPAPFNGRVVITPGATKVTIGMEPANVAAADFLGLANGVINWADSTGAITTLNGVGIPRGGVGIVSETFTATVPVIWEPQNLMNPTVPSAPTPAVDFRNNPEYYYAYDYSWICYLVSKAYATALSDFPVSPTTASLQGQLNAWWAAQGYTGTAPTWRFSAPCLTYSPSTQLFTLAADQWATGRRGVPATSTGALWPDAGESLVIGMNQMLLWKFPFSSIANRISPSALPGFEYTLEFATSSITTGTLDDGTAANLLSMDFTCTDAMWSPIEELVLTSNLSVVQEATAAPLDIIDATSAPVASSSYLTYPVLQSIQVAGAADGFRGTIEFEPPLLKYVDILPSSSIRSLSFQLYWRRKQDNALILMGIPPGGFFRVRLQFLLKDYVN